jgi:hypothetical protein
MLLAKTQAPDAVVGSRHWDQAAPLHIRTARLACSAQPVTVGIPFARRDLTDVATLALTNEAGIERPAQFEPLAYWHDGSIRWLLTDFVLPALACHDTTWQLSRDMSSAEHDDPARLRFTESAKEVRVDTGAAEFTIARNGSRRFPSVWVEGVDVLDANRSALIFRDAEQLHDLQVEEMAIEARGPIRATVRIVGRLASLRCTLRYCFFSGTGLVRVRVTLHNPRAARHRGGLWDLGDPGSVLFRELALQLALKVTHHPRLAWACEPQEPLQARSARRLEIYQDSSGGENWMSRSHVNRHGKVPCSFRGYRERCDGVERFGLRASPIVQLRSDQVTITAALPEFWQQFPKSIEVNDGVLKLGLFPQQHSEVHELQGGEQKTHSLWLDFAAESPAALEWVHDPARVHCSRECYSTTGVVPWLTENAFSAEARFDETLASAIAGPDRLTARREIIDEFGWRNFGELYADHEAEHFPGPPPVVSHYNNQYDALWGMLQQYLRTADSRWLELLDPLARHVIDIDIYHTTEDKPAYNGGLFWHTDHYRDASTATHRAYARANSPANQPYGGGPCNEHNYTTGLLYFHYLTGDPQARDAVLSLADWVIAMDDGRLHPLGVFDAGPTGFATSTSEPSYHGPGRGAGNSINALVDAWLLTDREHYLAYAELLIRRCVHPHDDVEALNLLDLERRWSYTVFLSALARYLALKIEHGQHDAMYAYGREALVHYAAWMVDRERPYFDQVERLEYPSATWAAQELRKANVLRMSAVHAVEPLRGRLLERGAELSERAWRDLGRFGTRLTLRPLTILLREGMCDCCFRSGASVPSLPVTMETCHAGREKFQPQRARIRRRLGTVSGLMHAALKLINPWNLARLLPLVRT